MSIEINTGIQKVSAMPEVEGDGKALVSVNGEWVEQIGYGYKTIEELLNETVEVSGGYGETPTIHLVADEYYTVIFDGVRYENVIAAKCSIWVQLGDDTLTTYPFCLGDWIGLTAEDGTHTIIVYGEEYSKIDKKYLPNGNIKDGSGEDSLQSGSGSTATAKNSYAFGLNCEANSWISHAEGSGCKASGQCSAAFGGYTIAKNTEFVVGMYNKESPDYPTDRNKRTLFIVGGGSDSSNRKNALAVDMQGGIVVPASDNQNKFFRITVNSSGVISATEVTA